ncbi:MAG: RNA polymerase sigma factor, partial [Myxococcota bacterium]
LYMPDTRTDEELMELVAQNDEAAFALLVDRYQQPIFSMCVSFGLESSLAEEATQDTFVQLWKNRARYQPRGKFRAYLYAICIARSRHSKRTHWRWKRRNDAYAVDPGHQALLRDSGISPSERHRLASALEHLPQNQREAVILRYFGDLDYDEISAITGISTSTLRTRVQTGLEKLARKLGGQR